MAAEAAATLFAGVEVKELPRLTADDDGVLVEDFTKETTGVVERPLPPRMTPDSVLPRLPPPPPLLPPARSRWCPAMSGLERVASPRAVDDPCGLVDESGTVKATAATGERALELEVLPRNESCDCEEDDLPNTDSWGTRGGSKPMPASSSNDASAV